MRAIIFLFAFTLPIGAAEARSTLESKLVGHYSTQQTKIFQEGVQWFCETELRPRMKLASEPSSLALFPKLSKDKKARECRDKLYLAHDNNGNKSLWNGCADEPEAKKFLAALAVDCVR